MEVVRGMEKADRWSVRCAAVANRLCTLDLKVAEREAEGGNGTRPRFTVRAIGSQALDGCSPLNSGKPLKYNHGSGPMNTDRPYAIRRYAMSVDPSAAIGVHPRSSVAEMRVPGANRALKTR